MTRLDAVIAAHVDAANDFAAWIDRLISYIFRDLTLRQFTDASQRAAARACVIRQRESLSAEIALISTGLGHLGVNYVRPACDETVWLSYISGLSKSHAHKLVLLMSVEESARSVSAQREYLGDDIMEHIGFPRNWLSYLDRTAAKVGADMGRLAEELSWPSRKRVPDTGWIAKTTDKLELYNYLYSATSRTLHFSPQEIVRRTWWTGGVTGDEQLMFNSRGYSDYRTDFALYWIPTLLLYSIIEAIAIENQFIQGSDPIPSDFYSQFEEMIGEWAARVPPVPIVTPAEFNLLTEQDGARIFGPK